MRAPRGELLPKATPRRGARGGKALVRRGYRRADTKRSSSPPAGTAACEEWEEDQAAHDVMGCEGDVMCCKADVMGCEGDVLGFEEGGLCLWCSTERGSSRACVGRASWCILSAPLGWGP